MYQLPVDLMTFPNMDYFCPKIADFTIFSLRKNARYADHKI
ncbi:hypothetical protein C943_00714 [Mariniradius saccharolyticus AK6]|uniref:Uncharacterized protein n=1 Tax=Mariniradius saccharolyticus AK6 TaxID=1239962 RepID=M7XCU6_9BACT|nr:hypothetical protein C943_00714 [Mariniradius saccharolyticus AK6]